MSVYPVRRFLIYFLGVNAVLALLVWLALRWYTSHGDAIQVPSLRGLSADEALVALEESGLEGIVVDSVYSEGLGPAVVVSSDPEAGFEVKSGRMVYLT
ncbi:MAG: PASTA domain-containing protein, partial [Bacteroidia bacterium]